MKQIITAFKNMRRVANERSEKKNLDFLLGQKSPGKDLYELLDWLSRIIIWMGKDKSQAAVRAKFLHQLLERNPEFKDNFIFHLSRIIKQTDIFDLLVQTQFSGRPQFLSEMVRRITLQLLPQPQFDTHIVKYFTNLFSEIEDSEWVRTLPKEFIHFLIVEIKKQEPDVYTPYYNQYLSALVYISVQVQSLGLQPEIRERLENGRDILQMPFFTLQGLVERYVYENDGQIRDQLKADIKKTIIQCRLAVEDVVSHMNYFGVSLEIVFSTQRILSLLDRFETLIQLEDETIKFEAQILKVICYCIIDCHRKQSVRFLFDQSTRLLAQKITERNALTGEHYIAHEKSEFITIFKAALGGGGLTALTVVLKTLIGALGLGGFILGFLNSINYGLSFLTIHFLHFTLATKQPAMTAPVLAYRLKLARAKTDFEPVVIEIKDLLKTQLLGIAGNLAMVIPITLVFSLIADLVVSKPLFSPAYAYRVFDDHVIYGPSLFYAIFTGILLWITGVFTGLADNWYKYHKISLALRQNRILYLSFSQDALKRFTQFLESNFSAIAGNVFLGFCLGVVPVFIQFIGFPIEVRHVTLATGSLAAASYTLGTSVFSEPQFYLAILGVIGIGFLNLTVSFALAFVIAVKAAGVGRRSLVYLSALLVGKSGSDGGRSPQKV